MARVLLALLIANVRYWRTVAPLLRVELTHWRRRAGAISDPELRELALRKLSEESFNAEAAGMLATLAPRANRAPVVRAIVALEVLFDLLDGMTERPLRDPLGDGEELFGAFTTVFDTPPAPAPGATPGCGYLSELSLAASCALAELPATGVLRPRLQACASRATQAQIHMHALPALGMDQLEAWARTHAVPTGLGWRELLAGSASSVLAVHALIAAAADPSSTAAQAEQLDRCYLSICVLVTLLDGLIDVSEDARTGEPSYASLFESREALAQTLNDLAARAAREARALPDGATHLMILTGVLAYYLSTPGADGPALAEVKRSMGPLILPALAVMRAWRATRRVLSRAH